MGLIDGDAAWYAQEMARRAANRAAQEAAREQERIDRERYESSSRSGYGSWAKGPAPSGNMFAKLTMDALIQKRNEYIEELKRAEQSLDGSRAAQVRDLLESANCEIDRRNNFDVLSKTERAEIERLASKQNEELRKERDALKDKVHERNVQLNSAYDQIAEWKKGAERDKRTIANLQGELEDAHRALDEAQKLIEELCERLKRLEAAGSSTDGQDSTAASS